MRAASDIDCATCDRHLKNAWIGRVCSPGFDGTGESTYVCAECREAKEAAIRARYGGVEFHPMFGYQEPVVLPDVPPAGAPTPGQLDIFGGVVA